MLLFETMLTYRVDKRGRTELILILCNPLYHNLDIQQRQEVIPLVYVSEIKWKFLYNGALRCLADVHTNDVIDTGDDRILILCLNTPIGRYVSLVFPKLTETYKSQKQFFFSSLAPKEIISNEG